MKGHSHLKFLENKVLAFYVMSCSGHRKITARETFFTAKKVDYNLSLPIFSENILFAKSPVHRNPVTLIKLPKLKCILQKHGALETELDDVLF